MTVEQKVWEKQLTALGYDPTSWLTYEEDCGSPTQGARVATLYIQRGSPASCSPLTFSLLTAECFPSRSSSFAMSDYKVPVNAFIKKDIRTGHNPYCPTMWGILK
jgi:hypothetical protein